MSKLSPTDLFFLFRDALWCVQLSGGAVVRDSVRRRPRGAGQSAAALLDAVLGSLGRKRSVLLFLSEAWCQTIDLAELQIEGLTKKELGSMLAFEAETFSGLPAGQSAFAWTLGKPSDSRVPCTILQMPVEELRAMANVFLRHRVSLLGVSHPLFLAEGAAAGPGGDWTVERVVGQAGQFLALGEVPVISPPLPPPSPYRCFLIGGILAVLAGAICWQADLWSRREIRRMHTENKTLSDLQAQLSRLTKQRQTLLDEVKKKEAEHTAALEKERKMRQARGAMAFLFRAMADACPSSLAIRKIEPFGPFGMKAGGWCVTPKDADTFFLTCGRMVATRGWCLRPESIEAQRKFGSGGPCRFSFVLLPPGYKELTARQVEPDEDKEFF